MFHLLTSKPNTNHNNWPEFNKIQKHGKTLKELDTNLTHGVIQVHYSFANIV